MKYTLLVQISFTVLAMMVTGCAGLVSSDIPLIGTTPMRYSETPQMLTSDKRKYKRMTKQQMEEESELQSQAGSLWVMEGQNSYLFAQNKTRREGDALNIKLEGPGLKQVETKANVIQDLLKQIEEENKPKAGIQQQMAGGENSNGGRAPAAAAPAAAEKKEDAKVNLDEIQNIQAKLVEKMPDGSYRVKGSQPFNINKKEFKVIVTGLVRPEDYSDTGISSNKLLDPQYDVVTLRRNEANEADVL